MNETKTIIRALIYIVAFIIVFSVAGSLLLRKETQRWQGEAEATEVRVSGKLPARILQFYVEEGSTVKKGDTLVLLSSPEIEAKFRQASAVEQAAAAQNRKVMHGARQQQINAAYEQWQRAQAGADIAEKTYHRVKNVYDKGVLSVQKRDEAEAGYKAAQALAKAAKAQYELALTGAQQEDKEAAAAMLHQAQGAVSEVQSYRDETCLLSPIAGEISDVFPKQGELVGSGAPIMNVVDLSDIWVVFNIREDKLSGISMGSTLEAIVPALGNKDIRLKVSHIKALGSYATWKATKVSGEFDLKSFEVKARPVEPVSGLRPGMSVQVTVK